MVDYGFCLKSPQSIIKSPWALLILFWSMVSQVDSDTVYNPHAHHLHAEPKPHLVHPFQAMVLRATDFSPVIFYGENGRVHMEYRPFWPKLLYTAGVLSEIMKGVGHTVSEVLQRAAVDFPGPTYGQPYYSPYAYHAPSPSIQQNRYYRPYHRPYVRRHPYPLERSHVPKQNQSQVLGQSQGPSLPQPRVVAQQHQLAQSQTRLRYYTITTPRTPQQNVVVKPPCHNYTSTTTTSTPANPRTIPTAPIYPRTIPTVPTTPRTTTEKPHWLEFVKLAMLAGAMAHNQTVVRE